MCKERLGETNHMIKGQNKVKCLGLECCALILWLHHNSNALNYSCSRRDEEKWLHFLHGFHQGLGPNVKHNPSGTSPTQAALTTHSLQRGLCKRHFWWIVHSGLLFTSVSKYPLVQSIIIIKAMEARIFQTAVKGRKKKNILKIIFLLYIQVSFSCIFWRYNLIFGKCFLCYFIMWSVYKNIYIKKLKIQMAWLIFMNLSLCFQDKERDKYRVVFYTVRPSMVAPPPQL